jgi:hypothetical protein
MLTLCQFEKYVIVRALRLDRDGEYIVKGLLGFLEEARIWNLKNEFSNFPIILLFIDWIGWISFAKFVKNFVFVFGLNGINRHGLSSFQCKGGGQDELRNCRI